MGNIFESYATCIFLKAGKGARSALRSILWAAILAEPRAAAAFARHCKARGRVEDIPSDLLEAKETPYVNLEDDPFPPSEEEQDDPTQSRREANTVGASATRPGEEAATLPGYCGMPRHGARHAVGAATGEAGRGSAVLLPSAARPSPWHSCPWQ